jgi:predicted phage baseplate assembly protein
MLRDIVLDNRTYADIVAELRRRIPNYTPEWTDHNDSDPGITMIQLFSWIGDMLLWRLNQVPEKNYRKFLELVGITLNPPAAATVDLTFTLTANDLAAVKIPQGTQVSLAGVSGGAPVIFETDSDLYAAGVTIKAIQTFDGAQYQLVTDSNSPAGNWFYPFTTDPQRGSILYVGMDNAFPAGNFTITFHSPETGTSTVESNLSVQTGFTPPVPANVVWEYWAGNTSQWQPLANVQDGTYALTRGGTVSFDAPADAQATQYGLLRKQSDTPLFWFRARIDQLLGTGYETAPRLADVLLNTVGATNAVTQGPEVLGRSSNQPEQTFTLANVPVLAKPAGVKGIVEVDEGNGYQLWTEVPDFAAYGRTDMVYTIDLTTGTITFGNGEQGKIPKWLSSDGSNLESNDLPNIGVTSYRSSGGAAGNTGAGTITSLETTLPFVDRVTNLRPSAGGQDQETPDQAKARAPMTLKTGTRAVTAEDFVYLAQITPGARIKRAAAVALRNPNTTVPTPGAITVIVVPDAFETAQPLPTQDTLNLVANWLDQHRLVTSELFVTAPTYRLVEIDAQVIAETSFKSGDLENALIAKLLAYFHPLTGGADGAGWPFGATIYFSDTYRQILNTLGVARIVTGSLKTFVDNQAQPDGADVALSPQDLAYSTVHRITVTYS